MPRRWSRRILIGFLSFALVAALGALLWRPVLHPMFRGWIEHGLKKKLIAEIIDRAQPHVPFKIEKLDLDADWKELQEGRVKKISLVVSRDGYRASLTGAFDLNREDEAGNWGADLFKISFRPEIRIQTPKEELPLLHLIGSATISGNPWDRFAEPLGFKVSLKESAWQWKEHGIKFKDLSFDAEWTSIYTGLDEDLDWEDSADAGFPKNLFVNLKIGDVDFTDPANKERAVHTSAVHVGVTTHFELLPLTLGPTIQTSIRSGQAELASGDLYLEVPMAKFPTRIEAELKSPEVISGDFIKRIVAQIGSPKSVYGSVEATSISPTAWKIDARSSRLSLPDLIPFISQLPKMKETLDAVEIKDGRILSKASATIELAGKKPQLVRSQARLDLDHLSARAPDFSTALRGGEMHFDVSTQGTKVQLDGKLGFPEFYFKKFSGQIATFPVKVSNHGAAGAGDWTVALDRGVPLKLKDIPIRLAPIRGAVRTDGEEVSYRFQTTAGLAPMGLQPFTSGLCTDPRIPPPPAEVSADFPRIEITGDSVEIDGGVDVKIFGGYAKAYDFALFDPFTEIPEFQFSAEWDQLRLDELGKWSGVGKMDGIMRGHLKDVVSQAWLSPNYELFWELKPQHDDEIVFSGQAMRNVLTIMAGADLQIAPWGWANNFAKWTVFGFPSDVFGGWDIDEAGMKVTSKDGDVIVETTTSEKVAREEGGQRYIIYAKPVGIKLGPLDLTKSRVKVPLKTARYPLIMDGEAFYRHVRLWGAALGKIAAAAAAKSIAKNGETNETQEFDLDCQPPEF